MTSRTVPQLFPRSRDGARDPVNVVTGTVGDLLDRFAADDALCHDERMRPLLDAILAAVEPHAAPEPLRPGTVALVRALGVHVRRQTGLRTRLLSDLLSVD
jgi:hypothetical protein